MSLSTNHHLLLSLTLTAIFLSSLSSLSGGNGIKTSRINEEELRKLVLGSRPPGCVNKCFSCRPCEATLVIPPLDRRMKRESGYQELSHREDDSYYLLSWKCKCGNKFYQP